MLTQFRDARPCSITTRLRRLNVKVSPTFLKVVDFWTWLMHIFHYITKQETIQCTIPFRKVYICNELDF